MSTDRSPQGREMLLARYTWTVSGHPLTESEMRTEFGPRVPSPHGPGWFHQPATPTSAAHIRAHGHKAVGTAVTTWIPPQTAIVVGDMPEPPGDWRRRDFPAATD